MSDPIIRHSGKHLEFRETTDGWEYVIRPNARGCVAIFAVTDDNQLVLTEQFRPPVERNVIELPAGLAGDIPLQEDEPLETAARRELKEETGFVAKKWEMLIEGPSSAGLTTEFNTIFCAREMTRVAPGGGTRDENIKVHIVDLNDVNTWCGDRRAEGKLVDFKIFAALEVFKVREGKTEGRLWY
ncbi:MAG: NUDIX hydrolase [Verrucomicrobiales bacterium]|nr:NUDIX hydrolase [Verrucomicrobiales bacterium]